MDLGTPPQPIAPVLSFGTAQRDMTGQLVLGTLAPGKSQRDPSQRLYLSNNSSTFEPGPEITVEASDAFHNGPGDKQPTVIARRGSDMLSFSGLTRRQEFCTFTLWCG